MCVVAGVAVRSRPPAGCRDTVKLPEIPVVPNDAVQDSHKVADAINPPASLTPDLPGESG